jgi:energy-coupling factor transport system ATP-binding protein
MALFEAKGLSFSYPLSDGKALDGIDLNIAKGELVLVTGRSGSGKTTLLKLFSRTLAPVGETGGELINNAESTGFVCQNPELGFVSQRVRGELAFGLENLKLTNDEISLKIGETASFFNLNELLDAELCVLSGGTKSAVAVASAVINGSEVLLLDEPYAQLDPKACSQLTTLLRRINEELGITVIVASHSSQELISLCSRLLILERGKILFDGRPADAAQKDELLPYLPVCASLFDSRPLTVRDAVLSANGLQEKPFAPQEKTEPAAELKHITFAYSKRDRDVLSNLDYTAYKGKINAVIGANASGKTTLLKVLAGVKKAYAGKVGINGRVAYMPQNVSFLFSADTVSGEIGADTAERLGISHCLNQNPFDLSGGQAQRLALGILLEQNADILLLDEPSKSLDSFAKKELAKLLKELCTQGKTVILVSHDLDFVGDNADYVAFLSDGFIAVNGERRAVLSSLDFYTTQVRRITKNYLRNAVSAEDLV